MSRDKYETLRSASRNQDNVELIIRVKGKIIHTESSHGACALVQLPVDGYGATTMREVWFNIDEIQEVVQ
jgi:hypothetical protein